MANQQQKQSVAIAILLGCLVLIGVVLLTRIGGRNPKVDSTRAAAERWAQQLDAQTNERGIYIRHAGDTLPENDAWGRPLRITYSQGGAMETLEVRSFGPDGVSHSNDDIVAGRASANLRGIGAGIRDGAEKTTEGAARGLVTGLADGVRNLRKSEPGGAPADDPAAPDDPNAPAEAPPAQPAAGDGSGGG
jgi:hypothetical protein